tara:strand:+ start:1548 stop:2372 length:825 start_codon:yes stop_codon:yes gene_type:complete
MNKNINISTGILCLCHDNINIKKLHFHYINNINLDIDSGLFDSIENDLKILLINRKVSLNFIEFLRGKYSISNKSYIARMISMMTKKEFNMLKTMNFSDLWMYVWGDVKYKNVYNKSLKRYNLIKDFIMGLPEPIYDEPEWEFPKGRAEYRETSYECANREFCEETGLTSDNYEILDIKPVLNEYVATNKIKYINKYYFSELVVKPTDFIINPLIKEQYNEIGKIQLYSLRESKELFREYQKGKITILNNIKNVLNVLLNYNKNYTKREIIELL